MNRGHLLAAFITVATVALVAVGTLWPGQTAIALAGEKGLLHPSSTPEAAVTNLAQDIGHQAWHKAYSSFANRAEFSETDFVRDLTGSYPSLRTYATLDHFEVRPLHASDNDALMQLKLHWSSVVGTFVDKRNLHVVRNGDSWTPEWPIVKETRVPPQVIPVNYLRWDVIYRGAGDDWGAQDVEAPHVRIVDMRPIERSDGVVILGELLNEDVVPAYVSVKATLQAKDGTPIAAEGSFDKISHLLLPKQVTPFFIPFHDVALSDVGSVHMDPLATLVPASADPVIEIQNQKFNPAPGATLVGDLVNQSGQVTNIAHVLSTFYNKNGQLVWIADQYVDRALLPHTPVHFSIKIPEDIARSVSNERTMTATYSSGGFS